MPESAQAGLDLRSVCRTLPGVLTRPNHQPFVCQAFNGRSISVQPTLW